jgi:hypothetical protein
MIKIYSDKTGKFYNTVDEANRAEFELKEKENLAKIQKEKEERELREKKEKEAAERKAAAEKVEAARQEMVKAQKVYQEALNAFVEKYHTYHFSTSDPTDIPTLFDVFNKIFLA